MMFSYVLALAAVAVCLWLGQWLTLWTQAPVPGAIFGMVLLLLGLLGLPHVPAALARLANGMLRHLTLWLLPSALGVLLYLDVLRQHWLPIALAVVAATVLTAAVTAWVFHLLSPRPPAPESTPGLLPPNREPS